jgi:glycosyltransferase involved in cell wall biosynthesis
MKPRITCVVPTYNRARTLATAINSVERQTVQDWELVVVDDRSNDNTAALVQSYVERDCRIRYTRNANRQGPAGARNFGAGQARGDWIAFLDSDDEWKPDFLQQMITTMEENPIIDLLMGDVEQVGGDQVLVHSYVHEQGRILVEQSVPIGNHLRLLTEEGLLLSVINNLYPFFIQASLSRKARIMEQPFKEELLGVEDIYYFLEAVSKRWTIGYLDKVVLRYHIHENNISNVNNQQGLNAVKNIDRGRELVKLWTMASQEIRCSRSEKDAMRRRLAGIFGWSLAYHGYCRSGNYWQGFRCSLNAIRLHPFHRSYWKLAGMSAARALYSRGVGI